MTQKYGFSIFFLGRFRIFENRPLNPVHSILLPENLRHVYVIVFVSISPGVECRAVLVVRPDFPQGFWGYFCKEPIKLEKCLKIHVCT